MLGDLAGAVRARPEPPDGIRALCRALCEEMSALRGGRPVELRFEHFPDEIEVIQVSAPAHPVEVRLDGERLDVSWVPLADDGRQHTVSVRIGERGGVIKSA